MEADGMQSKDTNTIDTFFKYLITDTYFFGYFH